MEFYNPYITSMTTINYNPYDVATTTQTGYNVPTYNANNTNG